MGMNNNESGASRIAVIFWLALLGLVIHISFKIVPVYMAYEQMKDTMTTKASVAQVLKDEEILKDLVTKAKELDLPLTAENFVVYRDLDRRKMMIKTAWEVEVHFLGGLYVYTYKFAPVVEENIMSL